MSKSSLSRTAELQDQASASFKIGSQVPRPASYQDECRRGLSTLATALGWSTNYDMLVNLLMSGWGQEPVPSAAPYRSLIGDDHSPFEYSVAFEGAGTELRLLLEAQGVPPGPEANEAAGLALNQRLASCPTVDLRRFSEVSDLFLSQPAAGGFSIWHAVSLSAEGRSAFKLYLNPLSQGSERAWPVVAEALTRLGFGQAVLRAVEQAMPRAGLDQLGYFSLDLSNSASARVKVYVAHPNISRAALDQLFQLSPHHRPADVTDYCEAMVPGRELFDRKPLMSCLSFVSGSERPHAMTLHLPIAHYVDSDAQTAERVSAWLKQHGLAHQAYEASIHAIAQRPLLASRGLQSYASFRRERGGLRFTAYLSPELFTSSPASRAGA